MSSFWSFQCFNFISKGHLTSYLPDILQAMELLLESQHHRDNIAAAVQARPDLHVLLVGSDRVSATSDTIWILSPLLRSVLSDLRHVQDSLVILPDFSHKHIKAALDIIEGNKEEDLVFSSTTRSLLETLGVQMKNCFVSHKTKIKIRDNQNKDCQIVKFVSTVKDCQVRMKTPYVKIKKMKLDVKVYNMDDVIDDTEINVEEDDEDDIQRLLLEHNPNYDDSDSDSDDGKQSDRDMQSQLLLDQDFSDSDDEPQFLHFVEELDEDYDELSMKTSQHQIQLKDKEESLKRNRIYYCDFCDKAFGKSSSRRVHIKRYHKILS